MGGREGRNNPHCHTSLTVGLESQVQGIRNDDQSLFPVTPLVSSLFLSFLSLEMFRNIFNLLANYTNAHELHMHESDIGVENVSMSWQWEPTEKIIIILK